MKYRITVYSIWEYGQRKDAEGNPHQEDCTYPLPNDLKDSDRTFILCDGMGGHDAGEVASSTVCETMGNFILNDRHDSEGIFTDEDLKNAIDAAFSALDKKDNGAEKKMGTTMTFLKLHNAGATVAHIGDSRVYHIRPGKDGENTDILFVTEDHSLVNDLIKIGELTREEARTSKQKNVITRAMQPNMERKPKADIKHITDIKAGDFFYMCSDGMLEQEEMENGESIRNIFSDAIKSVEDKVSILSEVTKNNKDNHTALIIQILEVEGAIKEKKYETTTIPSIGVGLIEDDESSEETMHSEDDETQERAKTNQNSSSNGNSQTESDNLDISNDDNKEGDDSEKGNLAQAILTASISKKNQPREFALSKSKPFLSKMIPRGVIVAMIVAACIVGINYIPSCLGDKVPEKVEHTQGRQRDTKRNNGDQRESHNQTQSQTESQHQAQAQEIALDAANSDAVQTATEDITQQPVVSNDGTVATIQLPSSDAVVNSDQQTVQETMNQ